MRLPPLIYFASILSLSSCLSQAATIDPNSCPYSQNKKCQILRDPDGSSADPQDCPKKFCHNETVVENGQIVCYFTCPPRLQ